MDPNPDAIMDLLAEEIDGLSDIIIGFLLLSPFIANPGLVYTFPHSSDIRIFSVRALPSSNLQNG
jgi:hypothetical protein